MVVKQVHNAQVLEFGASIKKILAQNPRGGRNRRFPERKEEPCIKEKLGGFSYALQGIAKPSPFAVMVERPIT